jgi:predicted small lipoprotein YifL
MHAMKKAILTIISAAAVVALTGCKEDEPTAPPDPDATVRVDNAPVSQVEGARFKVATHGTFQAVSYTREILVITDTKTGQKFLGITGVGVSELRRESETHLSIDADGNPSATTTTTTRER